MAKSRSFVFSTRRKLGHGVGFYQILTLEAQSIAKKRNLSKEKQSCALPTFLKPSIKFQRNRLPNDQDLRFFNVRPPPKFCLINLFMSNVSPAALKTFGSFQYVVRVVKFHFIFKAQTLELSGLQLIDSVFNFFISKLAQSALESATQHLVPSGFLQPHVDLFL